MCWRSSRYEGKRTEHLFLSWLKPSQVQIVQELSSLLQKREFFLDQENNLGVFIEQENNLGVFLEQENNLWMFFERENNLGMFLEQENNLWMFLEQENNLWKFLKQKKFIDVFRTRK